MTPLQRLALSVVAGALLAAGLWLLRAEDAPASTAPSASPAAPGSPTTAAAPAPPQTPSAPAPRRAIDSGAVTPEEAPSPRPAVEEAPSPFADANSEELQYAVKLVVGPDTGPTEWRKAAEVFQRCVDVNPTNHLCRRGVYAAWERLDSDGGPPTAFGKPITFQPGELQQVEERQRNQNLLRATERLNTSTPGP